MSRTNKTDASTSPIPGPRERMGKEHPEPLPVDLALRSHRNAGRRGDPDGRGWAVCNDPLRRTHPEVDGHLPSQKRRRPWLISDRSAIHLLVMCSETECSIRTSGGHLDRHQVVLTRSPMHFSGDLQISRVCIIYSV